MKLEAKKESRASPKEHKNTVAGTAEKQHGMANIFLR